MSRDFLESKSRQPSEVIVPYVAKWICDPRNAEKLSAAINKAIDAYKGSFQSLQNAAGQQQRLLHENPVDDALTAVNNLLVVSWSTAVTWFGSDRSGSLMKITKDDAKSFFQEHLAKDHDGGWKPVNHSFFGGRMSLKTTIVVEVLDAFRADHKANAPSRTDVLNAFTCLGRDVESGPDLARNIFFEIIGAINMIENPVRACCFSASGE